MGLNGQTAVVYLARGAADDCLTHFTAFVEAYKRYRPGADHKLSVVLKGFPSMELRDLGRATFEPISHDFIEADDAGFDLGAYAFAASVIDCDRICFLNTYSRPLCEDWLLKLAVNLEVPGTGLVGATGSFEPNYGADPRFPSFPNVHVRTNAFMMRTIHARRILGRLNIGSKNEAHLAEHGRNNITRQVFDLGLSPLIVGRNARGYAPEWWPTSCTFRQGAQENLLVEDNQTRSYASATRQMKAFLRLSAWGTKALYPPAALNL